jgi:hypothetical protein
VLGSLLKENFCNGIPVWDSGIYKMITDKKEIQELKDKIIELEFILKRSYKSQEKNTIVKVDTQKEQLSQNLKNIQQKLKFTKIVELENELFLYFQEYSKLLESQKIKFPLEEILVKLEKYEKKIKDLKDKSIQISKKNLLKNSRISDLQTENTNLRERNREILRENKILREKLKDKSQRKISVKEQVFSRPVSVLE